MTFTKSYEIQSGPEPITWSEYVDKSSTEFHNLLDQDCEENIYQDFFERNPAFIPGALEIVGHSGHYPYMGCLITQPEIGNLFRRKPDFLWLAQDSLSFTPVFIEIEKPSKKSFTSQGILSAEFNQALGQIKEWQGIFKTPANVMAFNNLFKLPAYITEKSFEPQYLLIYGRRSEYEDDDRLRILRNESQGSDLRIISYDRLKPEYDCSNAVTCEVKQGSYVVKHISSTYKYSPSGSEDLAKYHGFREKIDDMEHTSDERKEFLKSRYDYWVEYGKHGNKGIIYSSDCE